MLIFNNKLNKFIDIKAYGTINIIFSHLQQKIQLNFIIYWKNNQYFSYCFELDVLGSYTILESSLHVMNMDILYHRTHKNNKIKYPCILFFKSKILDYKNCSDDLINIGYTYKNYFDSIGEIKFNNDNKSNLKYLEYKTIIYYENY